MKSKVFVLDRRGRPLMPCSAKKARLLLTRKRARIHSYQPFTIRVVDRLLEDSVLQPVEVKIDPGSRVTGFAVVRGKDDSFTNITPLYLLELRHRGLQIRAKLQRRATYRRNRRQRKTRYRPSRFLNRTKPKGWLPPSLMHRLNSTIQQVRRFQRLIPVTAIAQELVRFDTQQLQNPEISGKEYQQGTLAGYEVREYLLEKWGRTCVYCDGRERFLQIDHIVPRSRGGSNRVSNLTLACPGCNQRKGSQCIEDFLAKDPSRLARILTHCKRPLRDVAAVNATRNRLYRELVGTELPVSTGTGGQTKWNRTCFGIPKTHAHDALCVGVVESVTGDWKQTPHTQHCESRGSYQRTLTDRFGFPRLYLARSKFAYGFKTGDLALLRRKTAVPGGSVTVRNQVCRVVIRQSGKFTVRSSRGDVSTTVHHRLTKIY